MNVFLSNHTNATNTTTDIILFEYVSSSLNEITYGIKYVARYDIVTISILTNVFDLLFSFICSIIFFIFFLFIFGIRFIVIPYYSIFSNLNLSPFKQNAKSIGNAKNRISTYLTSTIGPSITVNCNKNIKLNITNIAFLFLYMLYQKHKSNPQNIAPRENNIEIIGILLIVVSLEIL